MSALITKRDLKPSGWSPGNRATVARCPRRKIRRPTRGGSDEEVLMGLGYDDMVRYADASLAAHQQRVTELAA